MKHQIIGLFLILLGISTIIPSYLAYCWLIKNFNCSEKGAEAACVFTSIGLVIVFTVYGVIYTEKGMNKKN